MGIIIVMKSAISLLQVDGNELKMLCSKDTHLDTRTHTPICTHIYHIYIYAHICTHVQEDCAAVACRYAVALLPQVCMY